MQKAKVYKVGATRGRLAAKHRKQKAVPSNGRWILKKQQETRISSEETRGRVALQSRSESDAAGRGWWEEDVRLGKLHFLVFWCKKGM